MPMEIRRLDIGLEAISRWRQADEVHLPASGRLSPAFQPTQGELDAILRLPTLDEKLIGLMRPLKLDQDLLEAAVLAETMQQTLDYFIAASSGAFASPEMAEAAEILDAELDLQEIVLSALAALLRG